MSKKKKSTQNLKRRGTKRRSTRTQIPLWVWVAGGGASLIGPQPSATVEKALQEALVPTE